MYVRDIKEIAKIVTSHQNDLNFGRSQIQTPEIAITFYYRIVDGHTEFPHCMLLFDKSDKRSTHNLAIPNYIIPIKKRRKKTFFFFFFFFV